MFVFYFYEEGCERLTERFHHGDHTSENPDMVALHYKNWENADVPTRDKYWERVTYVTVSHKPSLSASDHCHTLHWPQH